MLPERPLRAIDFCDHALLATENGQLPSWATVRACPICARRWWLAAARQGGWEPLPRATALTFFAPLANALLAGHEYADGRTERGFYAYLATAPDDEADFAAFVASARDTAAAIAPPRDFGWRAIFASPRDTKAAVDPALLTRVWQWRAVGGALAAEGRAFVAGEPPPPFVRTPPLATTGRWLREGTAGQAPRLRQSIGPLSVTLDEDARADTVTLTLRLRDNAQAAAIPTRVYRGGETGDGILVWRGTLSDESREQQLIFPAGELVTFAIEVDTAW